MNFFQQQKQVRRLSRRLALLFIVAVVAVVAAVDGIIALVMLLWLNPPGAAYPPVLYVASAITLATILIATVVKTVRLRRGGGGRLATELGGTLVAADTDDPRLRRLHNVVEEVAIAAGVPVPLTYVLPKEEAINAFAAGRTPADAVIAVTAGALDRLNRDELQGIVAHEISHIVNGDIRFNMRMLGLTFGLEGVMVYGAILVRIEHIGPVALGVVFFGLGWVGALGGKVIKAAVSRQRELLADASAVQFTRQTNGLVGALKKVAGLPSGSRLKSGRTEEVSHMLFGEGLKLAAFLATHPPLPQRIKQLDPAFDLSRLPALTERWAAEPPSGMAEDALLGFTRPGEELPPAAATIKISPTEVVEAVAAPTSAALREASAIVASIPEDLLAATRRPDTAVQLMLGLLLSAGDEVRSQQLAVIGRRHGNGFDRAADQHAKAVGALHPSLRLPLAELAFPAVRGLMRTGQQKVLESITALINVDGRIDVFEYCLSRLIHSELHEVMHRKPPWPTRRYALADNRDAVATLLIVLARLGHADDAEAEAAFRAGLAELLPTARLPFTPPEAGVVALEESWPVLDGLVAREKEALVASMVTVLSHDGTLTVAETDVLRTVCAVLHCPLPLLDTTEATG